MRSCNSSFQDLNSTFNYTSIHVGGEVEFCFIETMHYQFQILGLLSSFVTACNGDFINGKICSNPWYSKYAIGFHDRCWPGEETGAYALQSRGEDGILDLQDSTRIKNSTGVVSDAPPYPWTHHPVCSPAKSGAETIFCVYTDTNFAFGRGISVIGRPQSVELISRNHVFHLSPLMHAQATSTNALPPYKVQRLPGRGYGLLANTTLQVGDIILSYTPIIVVQSLISENLTKEELRRLFRLGIEQLPQRTWNMFMALQGDAGGDEMYGRFTTNAFEVYDYEALFPETAVSD